MIKLLMVTEQYPPGFGGGGWSTYNLAKALDERDDVSVHVLAFNQDELESGLDVENLDVPRYPNERAYWHIKQEIDERKDGYDIIQGQHSLTIPPVSMVKDTPTTCMIRDYWPVCYRTGLYDRWGNNHTSCGARCIASTAMDFHVLSPYKLFNHSLRKRMLRNIDLIFGRSRFVEERLNDAGYENTAYLHNFLDLDIEPNLEQDALDHKVMFAGTMDTYKGPHLIVKQAPQIVEAHPDIEIHFFGDGPRKEELEQNAQDMGMENNLIFHGRVHPDTILEHMKTSKAVIFPSLWYEPLGRVVMESHRCGTPVVTFGRGGTSELLTDNDYLAEDTDKLADAVNTAIDEEKRIDYKPRTDKIVEKCVETYKNLI